MGGLRGVSTVFSASGGRLTGTTRLSSEVGGGNQNTGLRKTRARSRLGRGCGGSGEISAVALAALRSSSDISSTGLDRLPASSLVRIVVGRSSRVVDNLDLLNQHVEGTLGVIDGTTRPFCLQLDSLPKALSSTNARRRQHTDSSLLVAWVTSSPSAQTNLHRSLGVVVALDVGRLQGTNGLAVDDPIHLLLGPVDRVSVEIALAGNRVNRTTIVRVGVSFPEVVGLSFTGLRTDPLPVDLVEVVGLENDRGNDSTAGGRLHGDIQMSPHDVEIADNCWCVKLLLDTEDGTVRTTILDDVFSGGGREVGSRIAVDVAVRSSECRVVRTG